MNFQLGTTRTVVSFDKKVEWQGMKWVGLRVEGDVLVAQSLVLVDCPVHSLTQRNPVVVLRLRQRSRLRMCFRDV